MVYRNKIFSKKSQQGAYKRVINKRLTIRKVKKKTIFLVLFYLMTFFAQNFCSIQIIVNMTNEELMAKVQEIIVEKLGVSEDEITPEASFTDDLGADSLDTVEIIMDFEGAFEVEIPDEDAEKIATVGDAIEYVKTKLA